MTLGEKLNSLRKQRRKTLKDMSAEINVSMNTLYRWERDLVRPRKAMLSKLAEHFNVSVDYLLLENAEASLVNEIEQDLLVNFRKLPESNKYRVLGYIERMCAEPQA